MKPSLFIQEKYGSDGEPVHKPQPKEEKPESKLQWVMRKIWKTELTKDGKLGENYCQNK